MNALRTVLSAVADSMTPDGTLARIRFRTTLDMLVTFAVMLLAIALAIGYQVIGPLARRMGWFD